MLDFNSLVTAFQDRVGFEQPYNTIDFQLLADDLLTSESGLFYTACSEFLETRILDQTFQDFEGISFPIWEVGTTYDLGVKVKEEINGHGFVYTSLIASNLGNQPSIDPTSWESALSTELRRRENNAIKKVFSDVIALNNIDKHQKRIFDSTVIFNPHSTSKKREKSGRAIGWCLSLEHANSLNISMPQIGLKYDTAESFDVHLYHTSQSEPIDTKNITIEVADIDKFVWKDLAFEVQNYSTLYDTGGRFFVVVFEGDLSGQLYQYDAGFYCGLDNNNINFVESITTEIRSENITGTTIDFLEFFEAANVYQYSAFNLKITIDADPQNIIEDNKSLFDTIIQTGVAVELLKSVRNQGIAGRINFVSENVIPQLDLELFGNKSEGVGVMGLIDRYNDYIKQLQIDFSELDRIIYGNNKNLIEGFI